MTKVKKFKGDRFVLCTFSLFGGGVPTVLEQSDDIQKLCATIPNYWEEELSICEVVDSEWVTSHNDPTDSNPVQVRTLFEVSMNEFPTEDEE